MWSSCRVVAPYEPTDQSDSCTSLNGDKNQIEESISEPCPVLAECSTDSNLGMIER